MPAGDQRGQIKCFTAGTQVRRRANTRTHLLPRSIVPGASVSSSGGLGSWGFLIGQADPADTRSLPLQWSTGTYHCLGVGDVPGKLGLSSTKDWERASYTGGPWGPPISHTGGLLPPTSAASPMGGQSRGSRELTTSPSRGLLHGHLVSRFKRVKSSPIYISIHRPWFCCGSKHNGHPADRLPQRTKSTVGSLPTPTSLILFKAAWSIN